MLLGNIFRDSSPRERGKNSAVQSAWKYTYDINTPITHLSEEQLLTAPTFVSSGQQLGPSLASFPMRSDLSAHLPQGSAQSSCTLGARLPACSFHVCLSVCPYVRLSAFSPILSLRPSFIHVSFVSPSYVNKKVYALSELTHCNKCMN